MVKGCLSDRGGHCSRRALAAHPSTGQKREDHLHEVGEFNLISYKPEHPEKGVCHVLTPMDEAVLSLRITSVTRDKGIERHEVHEMYLQSPTLN